MFSDNPDQRLTHCMLLTIMWILVRHDGEPYNIIYLFVLITICFLWAWFIPYLRNRATKKSGEAKHRKE